MIQIHLYCFIRNFLFIIEFLLQNTECNPETACSSEYINDDKCKYLFYKERHTIVTC